MDPEPGEMYPTEAASYVEACCQDLIDKSNNQSDMLLATLVRLGQIVERISNTFARDRITTNLDSLRHRMLWKCLEWELTEVKEKLPVQISQHSTSNHPSSHFV